MPTDFNALLPTFIEESLENLADIDETLLTLDLNAANTEQIDRLFRAAHTIKGNSNIFQLKSIGSLMHAIETLLDNFRSGTQKIEQIHIDLLLQASELIRTKLFDMQKHKKSDDVKIDHLTSTVNDVLGGITAEKQLSTTITKSSENKEPTITQNALPTPSGVSPDPSADVNYWNIILKPKKDIFKNKLKPERVFEFLKTVGELKINLDVTRLPSFADLDPYLCYLAWTLEFRSDITKPKILDVLNWVFEEEDIEINLQKKTDANPLEKTVPLGKMTEQVNKMIPGSPGFPAASTVRIPTYKIDNLINSVGELLIIESMFKQVLHKFESKNSGIIAEIFELLEKNSKQLQENVLSIRMVPVAFAINRFPRMVHELATKLGKKIDFIIQGEQTEIDKTMIEKITDPLLHIIRNSLDHGIESPGKREEMGKNVTGSITFSAYQLGESIAFEISDDGAGIDVEKIKTVALTKGIINKNSILSEEEVYSLLFKPGFSTSDKITDISGRGVGLDVAEKNIRELGGSIHIGSTLGKGTTFTIKIPLTLAIMNCQIVKVNNQNYIIPLQSIIEMEQVDTSKITQEGKKTFYHYNDLMISMIMLDELLQEEKSAIDNNKKFAIIIQGKVKSCAIICDELLMQQPIVIKTLEDNFTKVPGVVGATIMGDGSIGLILDIQEIIDISMQDDTNKKISTEHFFSQKFSEIAFNSKIEPLNVETGNGTLTKELLCFALDKKEYAINMEKIKEIIFWKNPTHLPFTPGYLKGIINLRGNMIPVIDLGKFFGLKPMVESKKGVIIIAQVEKSNMQKSIGLRVDAITDTQTIFNNRIEDIPKINHLILRNYIQGLVYIDHRVITLLQIQNMVSNE